MRPQSFWSTVRLRHCLGLLLLAMLALAPGKAARAQVFVTPNWNTERFGRFRLGAYATAWEFSPETRSIGLRSQDVRQEAEPSFLITGEYAVTPRLTVGGWYNRFTGTTDLRRRIRGIGAAGQPVLEYEADFWDVHATYDLSERQGISVQVGFSNLRYSFRTLPGGPVFGGPGAGGAQRERVAQLFSPNIWLTKSQQVAAPRVGRRSYPLTLFGSLGYYTAGDFGRAMNFITGATLDLGPHLSLSGAFWLNDFENHNVRLTAGLVGKL